MSFPSVPSMKKPATVTTGSVVISILVTIGMVSSNVRAVGLVVGGRSADQRRSYQVFPGEHRLAGGVRSAHAGEMFACLEPHRALGASRRPLSLRAKRSNPEPTVCRPWI